MEPFGLVSAAAGLLSLGISVCEGLLTYYRSWKDADATMTAMYEAIEALVKTFVVLKRTVSGSILTSDVVVRVEESIISCEIGLSLLDKKLKKIQLNSKNDDWKERSWARLQRTLYPFKESTLVKLKEKCYELRDNLNIALVTLQIDTSVITLQKLTVVESDVSKLSGEVKSLKMNSAATLRHVDGLLSIQQNEYLFNIYDWLCPLAGDFERKQQEIFNIAERQDRTAYWLLGTAEYSRWSNKVGNILWCTGMHGVGKSVLASFVVNNLQQIYQYSNVGIAYIYFSYKQIQRQTPSNLIANLLQQFIIQKCVIKDELLSLYERHARNRTRPLLNEYMSLLRTTLDAFSKAVIIIDGLDECPDSARKDFITKIREIQPAVCTFITSRYLPTIEQNLIDAIRIEIEPSDDDIRKYLEQRLAKWDTLKNHVKKDPGLHNKIIDSIVAKAKRMFLLARLYMESLMRLITLRKIKAALTLLPEGLDDMYDDALQRIKAQDSESALLAMKILSWTYFAVRPLTLEELRHALAVEPGDCFLDEDGLADKDLIMSACVGLISVQEGDIVTFIHYTIQEYFERRALVLFKDSEAEISQTCLIYLSFDEFSEGPNHDDESYETRLSKNPLLKYAASYWGVHVKRSSEAILKKSALEFLCHDGNVLASVQVKTVSESDNELKYPGYSQEYPKTMPSLVLVASLGLSTLTRTLIENGASLEEADSHGARALHRAVWGCHESTTQILLDLGADAETQINTQEPAHHSATAMEGYPLHLVAIKGNQTIFKQLLTKKTNINNPNGAGWTPLHLAAANGHIPIMQLLISQDATINAQDNHGATVIYRAAQDGQEAAVRLLLEHRADIHIKTKLDQSPLLGAAENGHEGITKLLLENGADWTIKDYLGWTPVYRAMEQGHDEVAGLLKRWAKERRKEMER